MPFAFLIIGGVFVVAAVRGNSAQLFSLLKSDLTGKNSYVFWILSILAIGALGYIDELKPLSRAFLVLVLIGLVLANGGFFNLFNASVNVITKAGAQNQFPNLSVAPGSATGVLNEGNVIGAVNNANQTPVTVEQPIFSDTL